MLHLYLSFPIFSGVSSLGTFSIAIQHFQKIWCRGFLFLLSKQTKRDVYVKKCCQL